jgi:hypothetical protein
MSSHLEAFRAGKVEGTLKDWERVIGLGNLSYLDNASGKYSATFFLMATIKRAGLPL